MKNLKEYLKKYIIVEWMDACGAIAEDKSKFEVPPSTLLVHTSTVGRLIKFDEHALLLFTEESESVVDYACIPKEWVVNITELSAKRERVKRRLKNERRKKERRT